MVWTEGWDGIGGMGIKDTHGLSVIMILFSFFFWLRRMSFIDEFTIEVSGLGILLVWQAHRIPRDGSIDDTLAPLPS